MAPAFTGSEPSQAIAEPPMDQVVRTAFYFESGGKNLFGWFYQLRNCTRNHGVVICQPLGHEQVHAHRTLRHLAERLAAQGFPVLRFDYHGTGDAEGTSTDPHRLDNWQINLSDAVQWMRTQGGIETVSLVGFRFGATLAALYAEHQRVENLVLWSPVVKGSRYVRELNALSQVASHGTDASEVVEAAGFIYTRETIEEISAMDLQKVTPRFRQALIVTAEGGPKEGALLEHLKQDGAQVSHQTFKGYEQMMAEPHDTEVPHTALTSIVDWLISLDSSGIQHLGERPSVASVTSVTLEGGNPARESIHRINESPDVFGVITEPAQGIGSRPWIVMLNAGAAYHIGPGRLHVGVARYLATLGFPCLRVDFCGLGDSVIDNIHRENDSYAATSFRDVALICNYLRSLAPGRPVVLMGLCSGAYVAFQSAARLSHPMIVESVLINPLTFFWREGMTINDSNTEQLSAWHGYSNAILKWDNWRLLLSGKTRTGFRGSIRRFLRMMTPRIRFARPTQTAAQGSHSNEYSHPPRKDLPGDLSRIARSSRMLSMFVSDNEPGHFMLMYQARRKATQLMREGHLRCFFIQNADHTFSNEQARRSLIQSLADYLRGRFG